MFHAEIFDTVHRMSMDRDERRAMKGRMAKTLLSGMDAFLEAEMARNSDPTDVIEIMPRALSFIGAQTICSLLHETPNEVPIGLRLIGEWLREDFERIAAGIADEIAAGKPCEAAQ